MNTKHIYLGLLGAALVFMAASCSSNQTEGEKILKQSDFPAPPVAEVHPNTFVNFGKQRIDNYYWMKDKTNPKVIEYIKAENAYTDTVMASTRDLQQKIYDEILGRIKEDDESYPTYDDGYYYYSRTEKGKQYRTYCRRKGSMDAPEEVIFDVNKLAAGKQAFIFRGYVISPDNSKAAYFYNETGSYAEFTMKVRDLASGQDVGFTVEGAASVAWANDNRTLFYSVESLKTPRGHSSTKRRKPSSAPTSRPQRRSNSSSSPAAAPQPRTSATSRPIGPRTPSKSSCPARKTSSTASMPTPTASSSAIKTRSTSTDSSTRRPSRATKTAKRGRSSCPTTRTSASKASTCSRIT